jgi:hypothetical protein
MIDAASKSNLLGNAPTTHPSAAFLRRYLIDGAFITPSWSIA